MPCAYSSCTSIKAKGVYRSDTSKTVKLIKFKNNITDGDVSPKQSRHLQRDWYWALEFAFMCTCFREPRGGLSSPTVFSAQTVTFVHLDIAMLLGLPLAWIHHSPLSQPLSPSAVLSRPQGKLNPALTFKCIQMQMWAPKCSGNICF